jgi:DNA-binding GntR family transcriptional regulator
VTARKTGTTKKDVIVAEMRTLIANGEIPRGERILQDQLAARFSTSITPVREAIRQLEAEGLLVSEPHRGVRVSSADIEHVKAVYVARRLLEPYAGQRAALRVSRQDLNHARDLIEQMSEPGGDVVELNRRFHFLFYDRCGLPPLTELIRNLWYAYPWDLLQVLTDRARRARQEHAEIVAAVETVDFARIEAAFATNLRASYEAVARHITGHDAVDVFELDVD